MSVGWRHIWGFAPNLAAMSSQYVTGSFWIVCRADEVYRAALSRCSATMLFTMLSSDGSRTRVRGLTSSANQRACVSDMLHDPATRHKRA